MHIHVNQGVLFTRYPWSSNFKHRPAVFRSRLHNYKVSLKLQPGRTLDSCTGTTGQNSGTTGQRMTQLGPLLTQLAEILAQWGRIQHRWRECRQSISCVEDITCYRYFHSWTWESGCPLKGRYENYLTFYRVNFSSQYSCTQRWVDRRASN